MKLFFSFIVGFGLLSSQARAIAQQQDMCKSFRLEAKIPANALHAEGVVPVQVKMTNISGKDFWMDSWSRDWRQLLLVARDAQGQAIPYSKDYQELLDEAKHAAITANVSTPIVAGSAIEYSFFLDKLFDLVPGGSYSLAVSRWCGNPDRQLEAGMIKFAVTQAASTSTDSSISIHLSTPETEYPLGWAVPVNISIQNHGDLIVPWATTEVWSELPDEFAMGVEIYDASGKALTKVPEAEAPWKTRHYPRGLIGFTQVPKHGVAERNIALGNLYDLSQPGVYTARVVLVDATTNALVESNSITFTLQPAEYFVEPKGRDMIPPFMMNIGYVPYRQHDGHIDPSSAAILMCNISNHEIWMFNASGNYAEILGPDKKAVSMSEEELKLWNQYNNPAISTVPKRQVSHNWFQLAPHQATQFGVMTYERSYDLSQIGYYRLRIYRYDEPDAAEETKLAGLPIVYSNWINFEVPAQPKKP